MEESQLLSDRLKNLSRFLHKGGDVKMVVKINSKVIENGRKNTLFFFISHFPFSGQ